jgi:hypothetical protein
MHQRQFTSVTAQQWEEFAHQVFNDDNGLPAPAYDPNLSKAISIMSGETPDLWPQFAALSHVPALALRGENSDILSGKTLSEMARRHPRLQSLTVRGQGHAPLLKDDSRSTPSPTSWPAPTGAVRNAGGSAGPCWWQSPPAEPACPAPVILTRLPRGGNSANIGKVP